MEYSGGGHRNVPTHVYKYTRNSYIAIGSVDKFILEDIHLVQFFVNTSVAVDIFIYTSIIYVAYSQRIYSFYDIVTF